MTDVNESDHEEALSSETPTRVVEGRFFAEREGLVVAPDCLGEVYQTSIGGQPVKILFPAPDPQDADPLPELVAPAMVYEHPAVTPEVPLWEWGKVNSADRAGWVSADITRLAYQFEVAGSDEDVKRACRHVAENLSTWWNCLEMWLDTFTELDLLNYGGHQLIPRAPEFSAYVRHDDGVVGPVRWRTHGGTFVVPADGKIPDHIVLTRCFRLAGDGAALPTEWQYLREARSWLNAGQTRHAVIDACTAAEVALAYQVHQLLDGTSAVVIEQLLKRCNGIAAVAEVVRKIGGETASPHEVGEKLARLRNSAAHAGSEPTHEEATSAVSVAATIVAQARPLDALT